MNKELKFMEAFRRN